MSASAASSVSLRGTILVLLFSALAGGTSTAVHVLPPEALPPSPFVLFALFLPSVSDLSGGRFFVLSW